jgi:acid phosphatase type 7
VYERFAPQTPDGVADPTNGIRQFTVGTGGASLYTFGTPIANSESRGTAHGVLKLTLHGAGYEFEFVSIAGQSFKDSGSGSCH